MGKHLYCKIARISGKQLHWLPKPLTTYLFSQCPNALTLMFYYKPKLFTANPHLRKCHSTPPHARVINPASARGLDPYSLRSFAIFSHQPKIYLHWYFSQRQSDNFFRSDLYRFYDASNLPLCKRKMTKARSKKNRSHTKLVTTKGKQVPLHECRPSTP